MVTVILQTIEARHREGECSAQGPTLRIPIQQQVPRVSTPDPYKETISPNHRKC